MTVTLRSLTLEDTAAVHDYARLPESSAFQPWGPNTEEETAAYVREAVAAGPDRLVFAILRDGGLVGAAELLLRGPAAAEIGYVVHPRHHGQGIATAAARQLLRLGFDEYARHRIYATCDPRNLASAAVLRRIGMRHEGRMRGTILLPTGWRDSDLYAVLEDD
ncbi:GNAT family N-acetyltransferase [Symbioplanes lichenis]|uniref:GNAT family N-acetyltransferase n=1 Tax=Symbioplanes lichenis TaxID=1629072 RepID=UPI002738FD82|nr:GNAT family N-acetyltransferase [Actinoplanes lichenis]